MGRPRRAIPASSIHLHIDSLLLEEIREEIRTINPNQSQGEFQQFFEQAARRQIDHLRAARVAKHGPAEVNSRIAQADEMHRTSKKRIARLEKVLGVMETYLAAERRSVNGYKG